MISERSRCCSVGEADTVPRSGRCGSAEADTERRSRLRGNSGSLGAQRMTSVCAIIEQRSLEGDLTLVSGLLQQLEQELAEYENAITSVLS